MNGVSEDEKLQAIEGLFAQAREFGLAPHLGPGDPPEEETAP